MNSLGQIMYSEREIFKLVSETNKKLQKNENHKTDSKLAVFWQKFSQHYEIKAHMENWSSFDLRQSGSEKKETPQN